jgi:hypothetical protein
LEDATGCCDRLPGRNSFLPSDRPQGKTRIHEKILEFVIRSGAETARSGVKARTNNKSEIDHEKRTGAVPRPDGGLFRTGNYSSN